MAAGRSVIDDTESVTVPGIQTPSDKYLRKNIEIILLKGVLEAIMPEVGRSSIPKLPSNLSDAVTRAR